MDIKKLAPWNWFQNEDKKHVLPVSRSSFRRRPERFFGDNFPDFMEEGSFFDNIQGGRGWPLSQLHNMLTPLTASGMIRPQMDISANDKEYTISVEIPGVSEKDVVIEVSGNNLVIKGEKNQEQEIKEKNYYSMERSYGAFYRTLALPDDAKQDNIKASFKNGIVTISILRNDKFHLDTKRVEIKELE